MTTSIIPKFLIAEYFYRALLSLNHETPKAETTPRLFVAYGQ